jgi:hypothetical protein
LEPRINAADQKLNYLFFNGEKRKESSLGFSVTYKVTAKPNTGIPSKGLLGITTYVREIRRVSLLLSIKIP